MARYTVTLAPEAVVQAIRIATWWRRNRRAAPRLFQLELDAALVHLADHPAIGRRADSRRICNARVLLLRRLPRLLPNRRRRPRRPRRPHPPRSPPPPETPLIHLYSSSTIHPHQDLQT